MDGNFKIRVFEYSSIQMISGIRAVLTGFEYYFRIRIFNYSRSCECGFMAVCGMKVYVPTASVVSAFLDK